MTYLEQEDIASVAQLPMDWEKLKNRTILLSGGTGFIGSFLLDVFRYRNAHFQDGIRAISLSRGGGTSDDTVRYLQADVTAPVALDDPVDYILHLASNTHPKQYAVDPVGTILTNILGCDNLLRLAVAKRARFLLVSSVEIYGEGSEDPMDESFCGYLDCNQARSGYNEAKRLCESLCQSYRKQHQVDFVTVRLARCFGPDKKADSKAMAQFLSNAAAGEDIVLKSAGQQRYSYCYVADAAGGILHALLEGKSAEAYNLAGDDEGKSLGQYAQQIAELAGTQAVFQITQEESVSKAVHALLDTGKLKSLGWQPLYSVSQGLERTLQIYQTRGKQSPSTAK